MNHDELIDELLAKIAKQKEEIASISMERYKTNCIITIPGLSNINLHTISDIDELINIASAILKEIDYLQKALLTLGLNFDLFYKAKYELYENWLNDLRVKCNKIQLSYKKKQLLIIENQLSELTSESKKKDLKLKDLQEQLLQLQG